VSLILTQMVAWGSVFHAPAVLYAHMASGTGIAPEFVFGGLTVMLLIGGLLSPAAGRVLERDGARRWMVIGSGLVALGLCVLAMARGPVAFLLAWAIFGAAMPIALNQGASTALVQIAPARARNAIAILLLVTGVSSFVAWPTLIWLADGLGWRGALVVFAALNVFVCMPLHAWSLPGPAQALRERDDPEPLPESLAPPPVPVRGAYALAAISFALGGMLTWGLPLHMVGILTGFGHAEKTAVAVGSLFGLGQMLARGFEMVGGRRFDILTIGVLAALLMPAALAALLVWGASPAGAVAFAIVYGLSTGFMSIVRAVAPLRLFGVAAYARVLGRLNVPQNIAFGVTPFGFALVRESWGAQALVEIALGLAWLCLVATVLLQLRVRAVERRAGRGASR
jgi:predicted MFS family arabinose efflux permease